MELEKNTANAFINYLIQHGYPKESIAIEWGDKNYSVDIAILDLDTNIPISIYEIKGKKNKSSYEFGIKQLKRYTSNLGYAVKTGLIFGKDGSPYFEYYDVTNAVYSDAPIDWEELRQQERIVEPYKYESLLAGSKSKIIDKKKKDQKKYVDKFKRECWFVITPIMLILLVLEYLGKYTFTTERLIVLGVLLVVIILPYFKAIKIGDVSLDRDTKEEKKND